MSIHLDLPSSSVTPLPQGMAGGWGVWKGCCPLAQCPLRGKKLLGACLFLSQMLAELLQATCSPRGPW